MANKNTKANSTKATVATVNMNVTANQLYGKLMSQTELRKELAKQTYQKVECDGKVKMVNAYARDYFVESYKKAEGLGNSAEWTARMIIAGTMNSEHYSECFINDSDFASQIGQSKAYISKAKDAVVIRDWLIENGYGSDWKPSTVEELIATFKDFAKKKLDFNEFMKVTNLTSSATTKAVRDAKQVYNESLVSTSKKEEQPKTDNQQTEQPKTDNQQTEQPKTDNQQTEQLTADNQQNEQPKDDVKALTYTSMKVSINFNGMVFDIELTDEKDRKVSNTIITALTDKIRAEYEKFKQNK